MMVDINWLKTWLLNNYIASNSPEVHTGVTYTTKQLASIWKRESHALRRSLAIYAWSASSSVEKASTADTVLSNPVVCLYATQEK